ncbi:MAG: aspartate aminotransferase family protein [Actinobacteria bacterium]|nr:MAG: aspartate aminotransferase family protein [Actinomycetota bacterium]REK37910.1 MAG: aspartate aminotransferase family protein [Actinomycetota bacterium]
MTTHAELHARHKEVLPSWLALYYQEPIALVEGEGRRVVDAEGNEYLDFFGGILTTMSGYKVPEVVEAIHRQADKMLHTSTLYLIESQIELAEKIAELSGIPDAKVFFTNSGTEANDAALMMATQYRKSNQIIAVRGSYHGKSHSSVAITGQRSWSATQLTPFNTVYVHGPYKYRSPFGHLPDDEFTRACVDDLENMIDVAVAGDVAAMIAEPIQGVGGFATPPDGFFGAMKEVIDREGGLWITDEVQTGWGRTGEYFWGYQAHGMTPDLLTFAKGLGNGLAIAGVVGRAEIIDCLKANSISTFGGNPLSTAGALANLDFLLSNDLQTNAYKVGQKLKSGITDIQSRHSEIGDVRGKGLMIGVEFVVPDGKDPDADTTARVMEEARKAGLLIGKGGLFGNTLRIAPPLTVTEEEAEEGLELLETAISKATK